MVSKEGRNAIPEYFTEIALIAVTDELNIASMLIDLPSPPNVFRMLDTINPRVPGSALVISKGDDPIG